MVASTDASSGAAGQLNTATHVAATNASSAGLSVSTATGIATTAALLVARVELSSSIRTPSY